MTVAERSAGRPRSVADALRRIMRNAADSRIRNEAPQQFERRVAISALRHDLRCVQSGGSTLLCGNGRLRQRQARSRVFSCVDDCGCTDGSRFGFSRRIIGEGAVCRSRTRLHREVEILSLRHRPIGSMNHGPAGQGGRSSRSRRYATELTKCLHRSRSLNPTLTGPWPTGDRTCSFRPGFFSPDGRIRRRYSFGRLRISRLR